MIDVSERIEINVIIIILYKHWVGWISLFFLKKNLNDEFLNLFKAGRVVEYAPPHTNMPYEGIDSTIRNLKSWNSNSRS